MRTLAVGVVAILSGALLGAQTGAVQPAPRTADGRPDLTGVYQASTRRGGWDAEAPGDAPGVAAARRAPDVPAAGRPEPIPYRPEARARAEELLARRSVDDPTTFCLPQASPRMTGVGLFPVQFVQTPTQLIVLYEYFWVFRVIPLDRTAHPDDVEPSHMGDSIGRWEGDTLVVDVTSFKPGGWLAAGFVHSDALHLVERYRRVDRDRLDYEVTIEDPNVLTRPHTQRITLMLREGTRLREYSCAENNLDPKVYDKLMANPTLFLRPGAR
jgi:hypothetical protein